MSRTQRLRRVLRRPSHGTIVAYLALFVAVSTGGAWAATKIGASAIKDNAIRSRAIKDGQVKTRDLHRRSVTASKLAANAVGNSALAPDAVTGDKVRDGSLGGADLGDGSIGNAKLAPNAVTGDKVADNSLTGADINESTLGTVPDATTVGGRAPSTFLSSTIVKAESAVGPGTALGDGTFAISEPCPAGTVLLSGGPANVAPTSWMVESFPSPGTTNAWTARINKNAQTDNFSVVVLCAQQ